MIGGGFTYVVLAPQHSLRRWLLVARAAPRGGQKVRFGIGGMLYWALGRFSIGPLKLRSDCRWLLVALTTPPGAR